MKKSKVPWWRRQLKIPSEPKTEKSQIQQPTRRLFTDEFQVGDRVAVIRYRHGWFDGRIAGNLISVSARSAVVRVDTEGMEGEYEIDKPKDIRKIS